MSGQITNDVQYMQAVEEYSRRREELFTQPMTHPSTLQELRRQLEDYEARQRMEA